MVGYGELEMVTYNENIIGYFIEPQLLVRSLNWVIISGKCKKGKIDVLQAQGDFGGHLEVREVTKSKSQRLRGKV